MSDYQKEYKKKYNQENKIITFPLKKPFYDELNKRSLYFDLSVNAYTKTLVTNALNEETISLISTTQKEYVAKYIQISRGIANNINQIAYNSNIGEVVDTGVLIQSLRHYEEEFTKFISKM